jgi:hypothetical protein
VDKSDYILFSGGAKGSEATFGETAEQFEIEEVNFTFDDHLIERDRGKRVLNHEELRNGDISLEYVSRLMNRRYTTSPLFRRILQSIWYQINNGQEIYVIGKILEDGTVKGGTGWGAEFAKICNKRLHVFDQQQNGWYNWNQQEWVSSDDPVISHTHFTGTGTRNIEDNGRQAIQGLFGRSFG